MSAKRPTPSEAEIKRLFARVEKLERAVFSGGQQSSSTAGHSQRAGGSAKPSVTLDFSMPIRAFVKKHGRSLSGPKQFTLLVAYLTKGDSSKRVSIVEIAKNWNKLTSLLQTQFNPAHASRARENDWVNTEKTGLYHLRPRWKDALA